MEKGRMMNYRQIFKAEIRVSNKYGEKFAFFVRVFLEKWGLFKTAWLTPKLASNTLCH